MFKIIENKDKKLCCAYRCANKRAEKDRFCPKHRKRYKKEHNPVSYYYDLLKCNAKRRGKKFTLTLPEFKYFCDQTDYLKLKGKKASSASIDRIDPARGYEAGNIQILSLAENTRKMHEDRKEQAPF